MACLFRVLLMATAIYAGSRWLAPQKQQDTGGDIHFEECAKAAGCLNNHTKVVLGSAFTNIMPWLASVGAAVAAADYDNDGCPDLYVVNSGRGDRNHLFRNRGNGTFEDVTDAVGVGCTSVNGGVLAGIWGHG